MSPSDLPDPEVARSLADAVPTPFWLDDPARPEPLARAVGTERADLAIVGAGFTGLWAAIEAKERDPGRSVVVLEGGRIGWAASGRNGGFVSSALTHGLENGIRRFPDEIGELERQGLETFRGLRDSIDRYGIDAGFEETSMVLFARRPHETDGFADAIDAQRRFGHEARVLDRDEAQGVLRSPVYIGALVLGGQGHALVNPARLAWGLRDAALRLGVRIHERSPARSVERAGVGLRVATDGGAVLAERVVLATNAFPPLVRAVRRYVVPVYDHVLMTEPLTADQRAGIGWAGREGLGDAAHRFHYFRLSADDRILWGGFEATYHYGSGFARRFEQDDRVHAHLARNFFEVFPQLEGIRFTHRWGGVIDTCSRYSVFFGTALDGRLAYAVGYTGLGVGATRFGALAALDLADGLDTERTRLSFVRRKPMPFPPEPIRSLGIRRTIRSYDRLDATGHEDRWLRLLGRLGLGFQS